MNELSQGRAGTGRNGRTVVREGSHVGRVEEPHARVPQNPGVAASLTGVVHGIGSDVRERPMHGVGLLEPLDEASPGAATLQIDGAPVEPWPAGPGLRSSSNVLNRSRRPNNPTVSVVIPTLNEARNLPYALWRLPECVTEVIVVDGRSSDDTAESARLMRPDVRVVLESAPGKGIAMQRGCAEATGDIIVLLDADGSADGAEISRFVDVLVAGADFAKGSRFLPGGGSGDLTQVRSLGNRMLTGVVNLLCQTRFTDLCYGYNAFWRDCLDFFDIDVSGFEVETRVMMMVATSGLTMVEVPSWEFDRVHGTSNLHAVGDGIRVLRTILKSTKDLHRGRRTVLVQTCAESIEAARS